MADVDTSIYRGYLGPIKSAAEFSRDAALADASQLDVLMGRQKLAQVQRANARQDQLMQLMQGLPAGATDQDRIQALRGGAFFDEADKLDTSLQTRSKTSADVTKAQAEAKAKEQETAFKALEHRIRGLQQFTDPEGAKEWLTDSVEAGHIPLKDAQLMVSKMPADPAKFAEWKGTTLQSLLDAKEQMAFVKPTAAQQLTADTLRANNDATNKRAAAEGAANRAVTIRGQDLRKQASDAARAAAEKRGSGPGKMSATLQKELIDSDDVAEQADNAITTLKEALAINTKAYSGKGAKLRAELRSNLPKSKVYGGDMDAADATIKLDNLIGNQALTSMKAIFGGNPTEGERAILLELQASVDKTPEQRADIINRGIALASKRGKLARARSGSIRNGSYLTEGANPLQDALNLYGEED